MNRRDRRAGGFPPLSPELSLIRDREVAELVVRNLEASGLDREQLEVEAIAAWYATLNTRLSPVRLMGEREARGIGESAPDVDV